MRVDAFDFPLPADRIAQRPARPRDSARLLVVGPEPYRLDDRQVRDLPNLLRPGDLLVTNDTRVIPARLAGRRGEARVELTLIQADRPGMWRALARPGRRLSPGDTIRFADDLSARVVSKGEAAGEGGVVTVAFDRAGPALAMALEKHGAMPLPPYIKRTEPDPRDREDYQTPFARRDGAVAAPTAGLHFTPSLLDALAERGIQRCTVTLHVGAGTFLPVRAEIASEHVMQPEWGEVDNAAAEAINRAREAGGRIVAIGSTALRLLETAAAEDGTVAPFTGETGLFILPGYRFRAVDLLMTNFHLPRSTLFMLVSAFAGRERMKRAYAHAIGAGYRFYSYGDATLLHPDPEAGP